MFDVIVCNPDESKYEGKFLGLFYTAVSRATTLGDDDGLNSALYFTGATVSKRITYAALERRYIHRTTSSSM